MEERLKELAIDLDEERCSFIIVSDLPSGEDSLLAIGGQPRVLISLLVSLLESNDYAKLFFETALAITTENLSQTTASC